MSRSRAYRRHKQAVKLARRYWILKHVVQLPPEWLHPQSVHFHVRCNCWEEPRASALARRRDERSWRREWGV